MFLIKLVCKKAKLKDIYRQYKQNIKFISVNNIHAYDYHTYKNHIQIITIKLYMVYHRIFLKSNLNKIDFKN